MPPTEQFKAERNGTPNGTVISPETDSISIAEDGDHRIVYLVIGGILLAFSLGIILLIVSAMSDWAN